MKVKKIKVQSECKAQALRTLKQKLTNTFLKRRHNLPKISLSKVCHMRKIVMILKIFL